MIAVLVEYSQKRDMEISGEGGMKDEWTDRKRKKPKKYLSPVSAVLAEAVEEMRCRRAMCYSCNG